MVVRRVRRPLRESKLEFNLGAWFARRELERSVRVVAVHDAHLTHLPTSHERIGVAPDERDVFFAELAASLGPQVLGRRGK